MQPILAVTVPFFGLVLAGWLAGRLHVLPESAIPGLNAFVLWFALPCLLFRFGAGTPVLELLNPAVLGVYLAAALVIVFFTLAVSLSAALPLKDAAFGALVAAFPNTGFMGVPMLAVLLGPRAAGPAICLILADLFVTTSLCIALAQWRDHTGNGQGAGVALGRVLRGTVSNPLPWAIALGALCSAAGWTPTGPLEAMVRMLADAATPVALFTIGTVLWRAGRQAADRAAPAGVWPVVAIKLLLHPLLVGSLALAAGRLGAPLSALEITVMTLVAALPSASNVSLLAERYGADNGRIARIILFSTVLAFVSFTALAWAFGVRPA